MLGGIVACERCGKVWPETFPLPYRSGVSIDDVLELAAVRKLARTGKARRIRLRADVSLREIAAPLGVSPVTVFRWETGERSPRGEKALAYAELLHRLEARP
jgi:DNA-binding transcriptional regulator YiaG